MREAAGAAEMKSVGNQAMAHGRGGQGLEVFRWSFVWGGGGRSLSTSTHLQTAAALSRT